MDLSDLDAHAGVCLNNKGARAGREPSHFPSVSQLVICMDEAVMAAFAAKLADRRSPAQILLYATLIVGDISPDSCFALVAFLARLAGVPADAVPREWLDYVTRWERGDVMTTGGPFESWGALHSALGHSFFNLNEARSPTDAHSRETIDRQARDGWRICLTYLVELLAASSIHPARLSRDLPIPEHQRALMLMRQEEQEYRRSIHFATRLQLLLPMRGPGVRHLLMDVYISTELVATGAKKVFLRHDTQHAELKQGFALVAMHRPALAGTGNDMAVSVEPSTGATLEELWRELERLEDDRWRGLRPRDRPRSGIAGYMDLSSGSPHPEAPNEPWYGNATRYTAELSSDESYTLIAAPRRIDGETLGSKLTFDDVVEALWRLYQPARKLKLRTDIGLCSLRECLGELHPIVFDAPAGSEDSKRLILACWPHLGPVAGDDGVDPFLQFTSTIRRYLAACAARSAEQAEIRLRDLPEEADFDVLTLHGGMAVIHRRGVFLLDDWRGEPLRSEELKGEFQAALKRLGVLRQVRQEINVVMADISEKILEKRKRNVVPLVEKLTELRTNIHQTLHATESTSDFHDVREFRRKLEARWGLAGELGEAFKVVKDMEDNLRAYSQARAAFFTSAIATLGFPLLVVLSWLNFLREKLVPGAFRALAQSASAAPMATSVDWEAITLGSLIYILALAIAVTIIWFGRRRRSRRRRPGNSKTN